MKALTDGLEVIGAERGEVARHVAIGKGEEENLIAAACEIERKREAVKNGIREYYVGGYGATLLYSSLNIVFRAIFWLLVFL